jgi:hypothetical protein
VQRIRRILFSSLAVCAAALASVAFLSLDRESSNESASPQRVASSRSVSSAREHAETSNDAELAQPQPPIVDAPSSLDGVTDEHIEAVFAAHPELRPSIEELLNDPDPNVRQQAAAMVLELAAATAETLPSQ